MKKIILILLSIFVLLSCNDSITPNKINSNFTLVRGWIYSYDNGSYGEKKLFYNEYYTDGLKTKFEIFAGTDTLICTDIYLYDDNKNLVKRNQIVTDSASHNTYTIYIYDNGRLYSELEFWEDDSKLRESIYEYDSLGKITKVNNKNYYFGPENPEVSCDIYSYDSKGNLIKKESCYDCDINRTFCTEETKYDNMNRVIEVTSDDFGLIKEEWHYNSNGLLSEKIMYIDGILKSKLVLEYIY